MGRVSLVTIYNIDSKKYTYLYSCQHGFSRSLHIDQHYGRRKAVARYQSVHYQVAPIIVSTEASGLQIRLFMRHLQPKWLIQTSKRSPSHHSEINILIQYFGCCIIPMSIRRNAGADNFRASSLYELMWTERATRLSGIKGFLSVLKNLQL